MREVIIIVYVKDVIAFGLLPNLVPARMPIVVVSPVAVENRPVRLGGNRRYDLLLISLYMVAGRINYDQMFPIRLSLAVYALAQPQ